MKARRSSSLRSRHSVAIEQQFDYFLDGDEFWKLLGEYAAHALDKPCWLVVIAIDKASKIEKRYGKENAAKLFKWTALAVDFRIKRRDVIGFISPRHLCILFYEENLQKTEDVLRIIDRLTLGIAQDQVKKKNLAWPMKQSKFDIFYKDWEGFLVDIGIGNERIWWARDRKMPSMDATLGFSKQPNFLDLKRELRLLDRRITVSIGFSRLHEGETAESWLGRSMNASKLASKKQKGNTVEVAPEDGKIERKGKKRPRN